MAYKLLMSRYKKPLLTNTYGEFIPSQKINENIIQNKNLSYSAIIYFKGYPYYSNMSSEEDLYLLRCKALNLYNLKENIQLKFIFKHHKNKDNLFENSWYLEITGNTKVEVLETANMLENNLTQYNPTILENQELYNFIFYHSNLCKKDVAHLQNQNIALHDVSSYSRVKIDETGDETGGIIENIDIKKHFTVLSLNFGSSIDTDYFLKMITSRVELEFIVNSKFFSRHSAVNSIDKDKKSISSSKTDGEVTVSQKKLNEIAEVNEVLLNDEANLCVYDAFIVVYADTREELTENVNTLKNIMSNFEVLLVEEKYLLGFFFLQRLIGFKLHNTFKFVAEHGDYLVYARKILSKTLSALFDFIEVPKGLTKCCWGSKPLAVFNTHYNNAYNFYLHVGEENVAVGHGVVLAPTGGGKTSFIQYIMLGILQNYKEDVDIYAFDRFSGMEIFTNWQGGKYIDFTSVGINPLSLDLSIDDNLLFLNNFFLMIGKSSSVEAKNIINLLVNAIAELPIESRILNDLVDEYVPNCELKDNLKMWSSGKYKNYLTTGEDVSLEGNFLTFAMDKILDNEELSAPIMYYMMHKIRQKARNTGRGHFIFCDETAKLLENEDFRTNIAIMLQEHRKLRGCVWLAFQNGNSFLSDVKLKELILGQCQNVVMFGGNNQGAIAESLGISDLMYETMESVKQSSRNPYYILLKKDKETIILDVNLKKKMGEDFKFLSSSALDVKKMIDLQQKHGEKWYNYF